MALKQQIVQRQGQSLQMTTRLRHAIKLLELPNLELYTYLQDLCLDNPLLELEAPKDAVLEDCFPVSKDNEGDEWHPSTFLDFDIPLAAPKKTLKHHIQDFIDLSFTDVKENLVATYFADHLDGNGYLRLSLDDAATRLQCPYSWLESVLHRLQAIEPTGLFARSLEECLKLQWQEKSWPLEPLACFFKYQDLFLKGDLVRLYKAMAMTADDFTLFLARMKECHPKVGQAFDQEIVQNAVPDLIFEKNETGDLFVSINERTHPALRINNTFEGAVSSKASGYLKTKHSEAGWLMKAVQQRRQNLLALGACLIEHQGDFFHKGVMGLKPLTLKDVAQDTGLHESTISRLTLQKFAVTPFGVVCLKHFFSGSIKALSSQEDDLSATRVKTELKMLIEAEESQKPYSDDHLVFELAKKGINLSRRTITKYRELLNIPSSYARKRTAKRVRAMSEL